MGLTNMCYWSINARTNINFILKPLQIDVITSFIQIFVYYLLEMSLIIFIATLFVSFL